MWVTLPGMRGLWCWQQQTSLRTTQRHSHHQHIGLMRHCCVMWTAPPAAAAAAAASGIVLGKHSGRHALASHLHHLGYDLSKQEVDELFKRFKVGGGVWHVLRGQGIVFTGHPQGGGHYVLWQHNVTAAVNTGGLQLLFCTSRCSQAGFCWAGRCAVGDPASVTK